MEASRQTWLDRRDLSKDDDLHGVMIYLMHEVDRLVLSAYDAAIESFNLTRAQWWALMHLDQEQGMSQSEFARHMQLQPAAAGQMLKRLEAKGWIERRPSARDERVRMVFLMPAFEEIAAQLRLTGDRAASTLFEGIANDDVRTAINVMLKIRENALREGFATRPDTEA